MPKPTYATALLVLTAIAGTTVASVHAARTREQHRLASARQYLVSIDPISIATQMSHASR